MNPVACSLHSESCKRPCPQKKNFFSPSFWTKDISVQIHSYLKIDSLLDSIEFKLFFLKWILRRKCCLQAHHKLPTICLGFSSKLQVHIFNCLRQINSDVCQASQPQLPFLQLPYLLSSPNLPFLSESHHHPPSHRQVKNPEANTNSFFIIIHADLSAPAFPLLKYTET